jgi:hypothetical protein
MKFFGSFRAFGPELSCWMKQQPQMLQGMHNEEYLWRIFKQDIRTAGRLLQLLQLWVSAACQCACAQQCSSFAVEGDVNVLRYC